MVAVSRVFSTRIERRIPTAFFGRVREILESARAGVARSVNTAQVMSNWLVGQALVEEEQKGRERAEYGERLLKALAEKLHTDFGVGYSYANLKLMRQFYLAFPSLLGEAGIGYAVRSQSGRAKKGYALRSQSLPALPAALPAADESWQPGRLHPNLSWTHYRTLMREGRFQARAFYEIETPKNNWSARELERQMASLLFDRLAKSRDKTGLMKLATRGQEISQVHAGRAADPQDLHQPLPALPADRRGAADRDQAGTAATCFARKQTDQEAGTKIMNRHVNAIAGRLSLRPPQCPNNKDHGNSI